METFSQFLSEETTEDYKVVILTVEVGDKSKTATKFQEQAKKMGMEVILCEFKKTSLTFDDGK